MRQHWSPLWIIGLCLCLFTLMISGCAPEESPDSPSTTSPLPTATATPSLALPVDTATPTPTATANAPQLPVPTASPLTSACAGLSGNLELGVQVGPADAVGLEPVAVGQVPIAVSGSAAPYPVTGGGAIDYNDVLEKEWGSYSVTMNMQATVSGNCSGASGMELLALTIDVSGDQLVVVTTEGFQNQYPWSGTHTFELEFPVMDGATNEGEGWAFTLLLAAE